MDQMSPDDAASLPFGREQTPRYTPHSEEVSGLGIALDLEAHRVQQRLRDALAKSHGFKRSLHASPKVKQNAEVLAALEKAAGDPREILALSSRGSSPGSSRASTQATTAHDGREPHRAAAPREPSTGEVRASIYKTRGPGGRGSTTGGATRPARELREGEFGSGAGSSGVRVRGGGGSVLLEAIAGGRGLVDAAQQVGRINRKLRGQNEATLSHEDTEHAVGALDAMALDDHEGEGGAGVLRRGSHSGDLYSWSDFEQLRRAN